MSHAERQADLSAGSLTMSELEARVRRIARETNSRKLQRAFAGVRSNRVSLARLNTTLMDLFRETRNLEAYSLLYELNHREFLMVILKRLRFLNSALDPNDILQDVFVSIFRYPFKFRDEKEFSFRNWSYSIIRNTLLKHLRAHSSAPVYLGESFEETLPDERQRSPLGSLVSAENRGEAGYLWMLLLAHYGQAFETRLNEREKRALTLVEVKGVRYREASADLGIKLENLKMVICRARKKIFRAIAEVAGGDT